MRVEHIIKKLKEFFHKKNPTIFIDYEYAQIYFQTLGDLLTSGVHISEALTIATDTLPKFSIYFKKVSLRMNSGQSLYSACTQAYINFGASLSIILSQSEYNSDLGKICLYCAQYAGIYTRVRNKIVQALIYPAVCACVVMLISIGILVGVVPHIQEVFTAFPINIPWYTQITLLVSNFLRTYPWWIVCGCGLFFGLVFFLRIYCIQFLKNIVSSVPILKNIYLLILCIEYIPILSLVAQDPRLHFNKEILLLRTEIIPIHNFIILNLKNGMPISEIVRMTNLPISESRYVSKIRVGEYNGTLETSLHAIRSEIVEIIINKLDSLIRIIEPSTLLIIALIVGGLALSVLTPLYSLTQVLRG